MHGGVGFPWILQAELFAVLFHRRHHFLHQQFDAAPAIGGRYRAVIAPEAHDARAGVLDQVLQPRDALIGRAADDHRVADLLLERRLAARFLRASDGELDEAAAAGW